MSYPYKVLFARDNKVNRQILAAVPLVTQLELQGDWLTSRPITYYMRSNKAEHLEFTFPHPNARRPCIERYIESLRQSSYRINDGQHSHELMCRDENVAGNDFPVIIQWCNPDPRRGSFIAIGGPDVPRSVIADSFECFMQSPMSRVLVQQPTNPIYSVTIS